jgi:hypothetical protein
VPITKLGDIPVAFVMLISPKILESKPKEKNVGLHHMGVEAGELISIFESCREEMTARTFGTL